MLGENHNAQNSLTDLKRSPFNSNALPPSSVSINLTYTKTNKLISALYMVTDIMDKDEPVRLKLRTLGANIISDTHSDIEHTHLKIMEVLSFINIALSVGIMSEMNAIILQKEFTELGTAVREYIANLRSFSGHQTLVEFMAEASDGLESIDQTETKSTRIGVQKGSTLMHALRGLEGKALKDIQMSDKPTIHYIGGKGVSNKKHTHPTGGEFDLLKKTRRREIISIIRSHTEGATITDIKNSATGTLASCGEKTLQRELVSMVKDSVLNKAGEKRWSRYFLPR